MRKRTRRTEAAFGAPHPTGQVRVNGPVPGRWLTLGKDGRLTAYALGDGALVRWTEGRAGGPEWAGPDLFPAPRLTHLSVVQGANSYVHFVGRRHTPGSGGAARVDLVHAVQYQSGRPVSEWRSLGTPVRDAARAEGLGVPTGAVNSAGTVHVLVRDADGRAAVRREDAKGRWEPWRTVGGADVVDGMAAVHTCDGRVEVLAPAARAALHWYQAEAGGDLRAGQSLPLAPAAGTVAGLETSPGRVTFYWTDPGDGGLVALRPGVWWGRLGGGPVGGGVSALRAGIDGYDCTIVAYVGVDGQVMLSAAVSENEGAGLWWSPTGEEGVGAPGLAVDVMGRVVLAVIGKDGVLRVARQRPDPGLMFEASTPV